ncbi:hypothetical protein Y032_0503g2637 [Ancylostoma ceylanicum]|uniref:Uncharacterized protein n=1 Tax=Ancylostoma ceylanicum TaxID=53326 RepID=A0A016WTH7_9BILA|nr:hypothetical protein Y032_0503g2637 [Ancylostoma ceylanicum]
MISEDWASCDSQISWRTSLVMNVKAVDTLDGSRGTTHGCLSSATPTARLPTAARKQALLEKWASFSACDSYGPQAFVDLRPCFCTLHCM